MRGDVAKGLLDVSCEAGTSVRAAFSFPPDLDVFSGHFPDHPILPGVLQIEMVRTAAERAFSCAFAISEIQKAKFLREIKPGDAIALRMTVVKEGERLTARAETFVGEERAGELRVILQG